MKLIGENKLSDEKPLLAVGFQEPSLVFNLNTNWVKFTDGATAERILKLDPTRIALVEPSIFALWINDRANLSIKARTRGYNYSKGRWVELFLVEQARTGEN